MGAAREISLNSSRRTITASVLAALLSWAAPLHVAAVEQRPLLVFAASSLTDVLEEIGAAYARDTGEHVKLSYAASSVLARQIEAGAPADVFFSADTDWMDYLSARNLIDTGTRQDLLGNRLVLIAAQASDIRLKIAPHFPLAATLGRRRLATGDPDAVPVGKYARSALTSLGVWDEVADRLVRAENVRSALAFVSRGEAPLGIVYETDALIDRGVRVVDVFPASSHAPIVYPVAATKTARPAAARFLSYLHGASAVAAFRRFGFSVLP
jgi:molybdate transport system substrate-binding protein